MRRLIDHGRWAEIDELLQGASVNPCLILAAAVELRTILKTLSHDVTSRAFRLLSKRRVNLASDDAWDNDWVALTATTAIVECALMHRVCTRQHAAELLARYLPPEPPRGLASKFSRVRFILLRAYCLRGALEDKPVELIDVAHAELRKELEKKTRHATSGDLQEFQEDVGALLPWHRLWASVVIGQTSAEDLFAEVNKTSELSAKAEQISYREESHTSDEIASLWMDILHQAKVNDRTHYLLFEQWKDKLKRPLSLRR